MLQSENIAVSAQCMLLPRLQPARGVRFATRFPSYVKRSEVPELHLKRPELLACKQGSVCTGRQTPGSFRPEHIAHGSKSSTHSLWCLP